MSDIHIDFLGVSGMSQMSFTDAEYGIKRKQTRREIFLADMDRGVPWKEFQALIEPVHPKAGNSRRPYELSAMTRIHFMRQWYGLSDPAMDEALYEIASIRRFAGLSLTKGAVPDETTILNFQVRWKNTNWLPKSLRRCIATWQAAA